MHRAVCQLLKKKNADNNSQTNKYEPQSNEKGMGNMERTGIKAEESNPAGFHGYLQAISRWRDGERERKGRATKKDKETCEFLF